MGAARNDPDIRVRADALRFLAAMPGDQPVATIEEMARTPGNEQLQRAHSRVEELEASILRLEETNTSHEQLRSDLEQSNTDLARSKAEAVQSLSATERSRDEIERSRSDLQCAPAPCVMPAARRFRSRI